MTGTRADYGILRPVIAAVDAEPGLTPMIFVTGAHLSPTFGSTVTTIEEDGYPIAARIESLLAGDSDASIARSFSIGAFGVADALERERPDILVLLGDRFETLAAASVASLMRIPLAHIHGGERTDGAVDDQIRHAISKLSHLHFAATETYAARLRQMGEDAERVFVSGAPSLDSIREVPLIDRGALAAGIGFDPARPFILCTYHSVTLALDKGQAEFDAVLAALETVDAEIVFTSPNADSGHQYIMDRLEQFGRRDNVHLVTTLGSRRYYSAMAEATMMVGNSSSGIIEAASFRLPVVNVGDRQAGRLSPENVIHVEGNEEAIRAGMRKARADDFVAGLSALENPYGDGHAAARIVRVLRDSALGEAVLTKRFVDGPWQKDRGP